MLYDVALTQLNVAKGSTVSHLLSDSLTNNLSASNSNPEIKDILQQFMYHLISISLVFIDSFIIRCIFSFIMLI